MCVVNSTVGCESLALGKPVVHFGRCIYQHYSIPCDDLKPETVKNIKCQIALYNSSLLKRGAHGME